MATSSPVTFPPAHYVAPGARRNSNATLLPRILTAPRIIYGGSTQAPADAHDPSTPGGAQFGGTMTESMLQADLSSGNWSNTGVSGDAPTQVKGMVMSPDAHLATAGPSAKNLISDLYLHGGGVSGGAYQMNVDLLTFHPTSPFRANGVTLAGRRHIIRNLTCDNLHGYMVVLRGSAAIQSTDPVNKIENIYGRLAWGGIYCDAGDTEIYGCQLTGIRDYGIWAQGSMRVHAGHIYGCGLAAIRLIGGPSECIGVAGSDSPYGFLLETGANGSWLRSCYSQGGSTACYQGNVRMRLDGCYARVKHNNAKGVVFGAATPGGYMNGGGVEIISGTNTTGIEILTHGIGINGVTVHGNGISGANGLVINAAALTGALIIINYADGFGVGGGFAVKITSMGAGNEIRVNGLVGEVNNLVSVGAGWSGRIVRNGVDLEEGTAYP